MLSSTSFADAVIVALKSVAAELTSACSFFRSSIASSRLMSAFTFADVPLEPAEQMAERARGLGQLFRTKHDQRDDRDDHDLADADVEHSAVAATAKARMRALRPFSLAASAPS
jgi:hypothetical protein